MKRCRLSGLRDVFTGFGDDTIEVTEIGADSIVGGEDLDGLDQDVLDLTAQAINSREALVSSSVDLDAEGVLIISGNDQLVLSGVTMNDLYDINLLL